MNFILVFFIMFSFVSFFAFFVATKFYKNEKKENCKLQEQITIYKSEIDFFKEIESIKMEVKKNNNAEKKSSINTGDVHSRNAAAADILRNGKNDL